MDDRALRQKMRIDFSADGNKDARVAGVCVASRKLTQGDIVGPIEAGQARGTFRISQNSAYADAAFRIRAEEAASTAYQNESISCCCSSVSAGPNDLENTIYPEFLAQFYT